MFNYEQRENTDEYRRGYEAIFSNGGKTRRKGRFDKEIDTKPNSKMFDEVSDAEIAR